MPPSHLRPITAADRDWLVESHVSSYALSDGFDASFGRLVAEIIDAFLEARDPNSEHGWILEQEGVRVGSIFCVRLDEMTAQLRLFFLAPEVRGQGFGRNLIKTCMKFAETAGYAGMRLWTHDGQVAACALYKAMGWQRIESKPAQSFVQNMVIETYAYRF